MFAFLNTLAKGGVVMIPLGICSLAALTVLIERIVILRRSSAESGTLMASIRACVAKGDLPGALEKAQASSGPVASVLAHGLRATLMGLNPQQAMDEEGLAQLPILQRRLVVLDTVVAIAPLLGLLGTVIGMIASFHILAIAGTENPGGITAGIAEALITTATGLIIAIFALVGFNWCQEKVRSIGTDMERRAVQLASWLVQIEKKDQAEIEKENEAKVASYQAL
ncbi:MAG: MotA/TolQ/ExbB proton channel family protein [Armatimonadetes bacterium]|nr:MotA/TolQ/ExbB proton channel family protein [Armatimonadota bacterium]NIM23168.1 MotA/TolQ/ExbB proton channel family protein [Armatimonadota bacterium]NIM67036.1 MotA/TolQ/ExbB proton channel family protein [Armatimonadota bacterium]NIM75570.1 MotA/TolQ/ExbB proton channel family protein [Armatimonadota bacterium]NIN05225.1 MotA/TolQ/ExbB proton channel family protein [Armatimonadota bacterium]